MILRTSKLINPNLKINDFVGYAILTIRRISLLIYVQKGKNQQNKKSPTDFAGLCSPNKSIDRTFKASFRFLRKSRYRNSIILAKELDECLCRGEFTSKADMAKSSGYSRARITGLLNLLSLSDQMLEQIRASDDYWVRPLVTERMLRALLALQEEEQIYEIEKIFEKSSKARKRQRCMTLGFLLKKRRRY